jgi:hypothetical protein
MVFCLCKVEQQNRRGACFWCEDVRRKCIELGTSRDTGNLTPGRAKQLAANLNITRKSSLRSSRSITPALCQKILYRRVRTQCATFYLGSEIPQKPTLGLGVFVKGSSDKKKKVCSQHVCGGFTQNKYQGLLLFQCGMIQEAASTSPKQESYLAHQWEGGSRGSGPPRQNLFRKNKKDQHTPRGLMDKASRRSRVRVPAGVWEGGVGALAPPGPKPVQQPTNPTSEDPSAFV